MGLGSGCVGGFASLDPIFSWDPKVFLSNVVFEKLGLGCHLYCPNTSACTLFPKFETMSSS